MNRKIEEFDVSNVETVKEVTSEDINKKEIVGENVVSKDLEEKKLEQLELTLQNTKNLSQSGTLNIGSIPKVSFTPPLKSGLKYAVMKHRVSIDGERIITYLQHDVQLGNFDDIPSFTLAKLKLVDDLLRLYDGILYNFTEEGIPNVYLSRTTSKSSMGSDPWWFMEHWKEPKNTNLRFALEKINLINPGSKYKNYRMFWTWGLKLEVGVQTALSELYENNFLDPEVVRNWLNDMVATSSYSYSKIKGEESLKGYKFYLPLVDHDHFRPVLEQNLVFRDHFNVLLRSLVFDLYYTPTVDESKVFEEALSIFKPVVTRLGESQNAQMIVLTPVVKTFLDFLMCILNGRFTEMSFNLKIANFDNFNPFLITSILICMVMCPDYMFSEMDRNQMRNYLVYQLLGNLGSSSIKMTFDDKDEYRKGEIDMLEDHDFIVPGKDGIVRAFLELMTDDNRKCFSQRGIKMEVLIPKEHARFYPGRTLFYSPTYFTESGKLLKKAGPTGGTILLRKLFEALTKAGPKAFVNNDSQFSDFIGIVKLISRHMTRFELTLFNIHKIIIRGIVGNPLFSPVAYGDTSTEEFTDKLEPYPVSDMFFAAFPVLIDGEKIRVQRPAEDLFFYAQNEFCFFSELSERIAHAEKILKNEELFSHTDRVKWILGGMTKKSLISDKIEPLMISLKNFLFNIPVKDSDYLFFRDRTKIITDFIDKLESITPGVFGYVNKFYFQGFMKSKLENVYSDRVYAFDSGSSFKLTKKYNGLDDLFDDLKEDKLKDVVDMTEGKGVIEYHLPIKVNYVEFTDLQDFTNVQFPFKVSSGVIKFGSLNYYYRQRNIHRLNVERGDLSLYTGPPRLLVDVKDSIFLKDELTLDDYLSMFVQVKVYTTDFGFVSSFEKLKKSNYQDEFLN